ncbi:MAG: hypothetical protein ACOCRO_00705 [Halanaerobiales bacterium]
MILKGRCKGHYVFTKDKNEIVTWEFTIESVWNGYMFSAGVIFKEGLVDGVAANEYFYKLSKAKRYARKIIYKPIERIKWEDITYKLTDEEIEQINKNYNKILGDD